MLRLSHVRMTLQATELQTKRMQSIIVIAETTPKLSTRTCMDLSSSKAS